MQSRLSRILVLLIVLVSNLSASAQTVTSLHTNDMHAQFVPLPATWIRDTPKPQIGGMVALDYFIQQQKQQYPNALVLDAGDITTGTLLSKIEYKGALNGGFVEMMNLIGYDAFTIGNHEFDDGQENLRHMMSLMEFDALSANLFLNDEPFVPLAYNIYKVNGVQVGVIGLVLSDLENVTAKKALTGIKVKDPIAMAQQVIDEIDAQTDLIVLLTHQGDDADRELADGVERADIIIGGHSHTRLTTAEIRNGILIVQAGSKTRDLGRLTVSVAADTVSAFDFELMSTWVDSVKTPNPQMQTLVQKFDSQIKAKYGQPIGTLYTDWENSNDDETGLGNFITDAMRDYTGTEFALLNSGGIRKSMAPGPVTKMDVMEILPFSNYMVTFECTGQELLSLLQNDIAGSIKNNYGLYQISGIHYAYSVDADDNATILSASVQGEAIQPNKIYRGTTVDFVMGRLQEHYTLQNVETDPKLIADVVIEYIQQNPDIRSEAEGRIKQVD
mgnify:CR=1 FL=1